MRAIFVIFSLSFVFFAGFAQVNTDSLFQSSLRYAVEKKFDASLSEAKKVVDIHPNRFDVLVHIANLYAWSERYDSASFYISKAYQINPADPDMFSSMMNILLWNADYAGLMHAANQAEAASYADTLNLVLKKLLAHKGLYKYDEAVVYAEAQSDNILNHPPIKALYNELYFLSLRKQFTLYHSTEFFDQKKMQPQFLTYADIGFKVKRHSLIFRVNHAHRFNMDDLQFETDFYWSLNKGRYIYLNYGKGIWNNLFSDHRAGAEFYFPVVNWFDASIGTRFLKFPASKAYIVTGSVSKYAGNSYFSFRPFYVIRDVGTAISLIGYYRYVLNKPSNYYGLELRYGNTPDDRYIISDKGDILKLNAYRLRAERNIYINLKHDVRFALGYSLEEFQTDNFRNRYLIESIWNYKF